MCVITSGRQKRDGKEGAGEKVDSSEKIFVGRSERWAQTFIKYQ